MLLSAQHVASPDGERRGRNAFLYLHGAEWPIGEATVDLVSALPGRLENEIIEVVPGGNSVLAYLDLVAPDATPRGAILEVLSQATHKVVAGSERVESNSRGTGLRFHAALIAPENRLHEFRQLAAQVARLLQKTTPPPWKGVPRLTVVAARTEGGWRLQVDPTSVARIRKRYPEWRLSSVSLTDDVLSDLRTVSSDIVPMILASAANLTPEQALELGGVAVVDEDGRLMRAWPDSRPSTTIGEDEAGALLGAARQQYGELRNAWRDGGPFDRKLLGPRVKALEGVIPKLERAARGQADPGDSPLVNNEAELIEELRIATK